MGKKTVSDEEARKLWHEVLVDDFGGKPVDEVAMDPSGNMVNIGAYPMGDGVHHPAERFVTKDSGARARFPSGMQRDTDDGKARFDLIMPQGLPYEEQLLTRWAHLMRRGAQKYDARNWEKARGPEELERFKGSAFRHLMQWLAGEGDEDHAAAVLFNITGAEFVQFHMGRDALSKEPSDGRGTRDSAIP